MKIFIICSKAFYSQIPKIKTELESRGHEITLPNSFDNPNAENEMRNLGSEIHSGWKAEMIRHSEQVITGMDAVLVLNFEKNGVRNYIGGATFLEMYDAFRLNKRIYLFNPIPDNMLMDEIIGFKPAIINGDLSQIV